MHQVRPLTYHATRVAYARHALRAALRRWGGYLLAALLVPALAGSAPVDTVLALLAAAGSPLWHVGRAPSPLAVLLAVGGTAMVAVLPLPAARHWWWPVAWAMAERALPLGSSTRRVSDLRMQAWFTAPVLAAGPLVGPNAHGARLMLLALLVLPLTAWLRQGLRLMLADWAPVLAALDAASVSFVREWLANESHERSAAWIFTSHEPLDEVGEHGAVIDLCRHQGRA